MPLKIFVCLLAVFCLVAGIYSFVSTKNNKEDKIFLIIMGVFYLLLGAAFFYLARWGVVIVP